MASTARTQTFAGKNGLKLVATRMSPQGPSRGQTALLLHGGGQTRHSWAGTGRVLSQKGFDVVILDQRGHGESDWAPDGAYDMADFADDIELIADHLYQTTGHRPIVIGASLGGLASMLCAARTNREVFDKLVLVDITPLMKHDGVAKILGFMAAKAREGFAHLDEAADAIAAYLPHRPRPKDLSGLKKNLRLDEDGRYRWHWDPRFLDTRSAEEVRAKEKDFVNLVSNLKLPVLLVRGRESELVGEEQARAFVDIVPHAKVADVSGARHMVAGDRNDVFTEAVLEFLEETESV